MKTSTNNDKKAAERMVHVRLPEELHVRLRVLVAARDETIQDFLATLIAREVERHDIHVPMAKKACPIQESDLPGTDERNEDI